MKKSLLLCLIFTFCYLKPSYSSTSPETPSGWLNGEGGQIENANQLLWLARTSEAWDETWELTNHIDLIEFKQATLNFPSIGNDTTNFSGQFDGNGFVISNLYINTESDINIGLFGILNHALVKNITLKDAETLGYGTAGCLAGSSQNSTIENCTVTGTSKSITKNVGGLIGFSSDSTNINQCSFIGNIEGKYGCGGLVGYSYKTTIQACFTSGNIKQSEDHRVSGLGGLVGVFNEHSLLRNSYSTASVTGEGICGGLIGSISNSSVDKCYYSGNVTGGEKAGAFIGTSIESVVTYCYTDNSFNTGLGKIADNDDSNNIISELSAQELSDPSNFNRWFFIKNPNYAAPWVLSGQIQPKLFWQLAQVITSKPDSMLFEGHVINNGIKLSEVGFILTIFNRKEIEPSYIAKITANDFQMNFVDSVFNGRLMKVQAYAMDTNGIIFKGETFQTPNYVQKTYGGGDGSTESPFLLYTLDHLRILSERPEDWAASFKLMANVDASETKYWNIGDHDDNAETPDQPTGFIPISIFKGSIHGQGHTISNLYVHNNGLAGFIAIGSNAKISNLYLNQCNITGGNRVGGIMGWAREQTVVSNCGVQGSINGKYVGGIVGFSSSNSGDILNCFSNALIKTQGPYKGGGIVGQKLGGNILNCYFNGALMGDENSKLGGITAHFDNGDNDTTSIRSCYVAGYIQKTKSSSIICFTKAKESKVVNCYYNNERVGNVTTTVWNRTSEGCVPLSNQEFSSAANFEGFDWGTTAASPWLSDFCLRPALYYDKNIVTVKISSEYKRAETQFCYVDQSYHRLDTINAFGLLTRGINDTVWQDISFSDVYNTYHSLRDLTSDSLYFIQTYGKTGSGRVYYSGIRIFNPTLDVQFITTENGTIQGETNQVIQKGRNTSSVKATPFEEFHFVMWQDMSGQKYSEENPLVIANVQESLQLKAIFESDALEVQFITSENGTILGEKDQAINEGENTSPVEAKPSEGYHFVMWQDMLGQKYSEENPLVISNVLEPIQLKAIFGINSYAFNGLPYGEGTVQIDRSTANEGEKVRFSIQAKEGYKLDSAYYNNSNVSDALNVVLSLCGIPSPEKDCAPVLATYSIGNAHEDGFLLAFFSPAINDGVIEILESDILVYPNPATTICHVQLKEPSTIRVFDVNGACLQTLQNNNGQVEIKDLKPGVYIISIQTKHRVMKKKIRFQ